MKVKLGGVYKITVTAHETGDVLDVVVSTRPTERGLRFFHNGYFKRKFDAWIGLWIEQAIRNFEKTDR